MGSFSLCFFLADSAVLTLLIRWFHGPIRYRELLPVRASTYIVSIINTQLAQAALALYLNRRFRTPLGEITSTVVLLILLEATNLFFFATVGSAAFPGGTPAIFFALPVLLAWSGSPSSASPAAASAPWAGARAATCSCRRSARSACGRASVSCASRVRCSSFRSWCTPRR